MPFYTHDNVPDSPINNFCTLNPLHFSPYYGASTLSEGNLKTTNGAVYNHNRSSFAFPNTGKYYAEVHAVSVTSGQTSVWGIITGSWELNWYSSNGGIYYDSGSGFALQTTISTFASGDVLGISYDASTNAVGFYKNGTLETSISNAILNGEKHIYFAPYNAVGVLNFGQDPTFGGSKSPTTTYPDANGLGQFHYQPPAGALALCTANIPEGPIKLSQDQTPSDNFKAVTWTGQTVGGAMTAWDGTTGTVNVGFQPDLVWIKDRTSTSNYNHQLYDSIRGNNSSLIVNENYSATDYSAFSSFNSNGFTVPNALGTNTLSENMVAWCWRAAGSPADGQAKIINEDGSDGTMSTADLKASTGASITPSKVSANRQNGFSIVKWNSGGTHPHTVGTGLNQAPEIVIAKVYNVTSPWVVFCKYLTNPGQSYLTLNETDNAVDFGSDLWNYSNWSSNKIGAQQQLHGNSNDVIAYCWHSVAGYSKIGSYVGNGSPDGPFVYCGFRVRWLMVKNVAVSNNWYIYDSARDDYNPTGLRLMPNLRNQEGGASNGEDFDLLSNGFKVRYATNQAFNASGQKIIFMAFAEQPFSGPSNAR